MTNPVIVSILITPFFNTLVNEGMLEYEDLARLAQTCKLIKTILYENETSRKFLGLSVFNKVFYNYLSKLPSHLSDFPERWSVVCFANLIDDVIHAGGNVILAKAKCYDDFVTYFSKNCYGDRFKSNIHLQGYTLLEMGRWVTFNSSGGYIFLDFFIGDKKSIEREYVTMLAYLKYYPNYVSRRLLISK